MLCGEMSEILTAVASGTYGDHHVSNLCLLLKRLVTQRYALFFHPLLLSLFKDSSFLFLAAFRLFFPM